MNPSHFVAIELDDRIFDFDLLHCCCLRLIRNFRDERISLCFSPVMEAARLHSQSVFKFVILVEALEGQEKFNAGFHGAGPTLLDGLSIWLAGVKAIGPRGIDVGNKRFENRLILRQALR